VVEDFAIETGKTKDLYTVANSLVENGKREKVLLIAKDRDDLTRRAGRNIAWLDYHDAGLLSVKDLFYATQLVMTESAVKALNEKYK
jgi:ribosomal protein L4